MQQFQTYGRILSDVRNSAEVLCHQQNKDGSHTLPSSLTNVGKYRTKQAVVMRERLFKQLNEIVQILLNWSFYER